MRGIGKLVAACLTVFLVLAAVGVGQINLAYANPISVPVSPPSRAANSIYIETDGTVNASDLIQKDGNTYRLNGDIQGYSVWIQCSDIVLDGQGYALLGNESASGVTLNCTENVTVQNLQISGYRNGVIIQQQLGDTEIAKYPDSSNNRVLNCSITGEFQYGIHIYFSSNNQVTNNNITATRNDMRWTYGVYCEESSNNKIVGNSVTGSNHGIRLIQWSEKLGYGNEIFENNLVNNSKGIIIEGAPENMISKNNITGSEEWGIQLLDTSQNVLFGNLVLDNTFGIFVSSSTYNTFSRNTISDNAGWAMQMNGSQGDNRFYRNNFVENNPGEDLQVSIPWYYSIEGADNQLVSLPGKANSWDYNGQGNYWGDYQTRYPNASEADTPYLINENNIDRYPALEPFELEENDSPPDTMPTPSPTATPTGQIDNDSRESAISILAITVAVMVAVVIVLALRKTCTPTQIIN
ncbi:MAG: right-handed parallel beta-helix repeat-containing protein [Candidatus Bathyarchaeota archaeon]|nr:right-handed parallel beta-helix repeat-containing protein [Candidatus Bathyarchaeota archaeon]